MQNISIVWVLTLSFRKIGLAHLACGLIAPERALYLETLRRIPEDEMRRLFTKAAALGVGIELNYSDMSCAVGEVDTVFRMFRIAKACGCRFYLGSDAHHPTTFDKVAPVFERAVDILKLTEEDKFTV